MGKCCDPLQSGMRTTMYSNGFCLISSDTIMWNIYDGEPSTWIKFIKLHKKARQNLGQQTCRNPFFTPIQSVKPKEEIWMVWVHWYKGGGIIGITIKHWLYSLCTCTWFQSFCWGENMCPEQVKTCVQNTRPELCCHHSAWNIVLHADAKSNGQMLWFPRTLDNISCNRRT